MIFYRTACGRLVGTQADARAINKDFEQIDIPTDKAGLMAFVQNLFDREDLLEKQILTSNNLPGREGGYTPAPGQLGLPPTGGSAVSPPRADSIEVAFVKPKDDFISEVHRQISIEEEIQNCDLPRLAVLAQNVAWRFHELGK